MAEHHAASDGKHKASTNAGGSVHGNSRPGAAGGGGGKGGLSGGLTQPAGWQSLLSFSILFLACLAGFSSRLFAVIRFESIIHEFDPWDAFRRWEPKLWGIQRCSSLKERLNLLKDAQLALYSTAFPQPCRGILSQ
uniref:STT3 oligosaccharyltransferase complex catalytic subunit B n=2 Tax=Amphiprion TaxID=80969 RepID=A0A3Q1AXT2_AMPOC